MIGHKNSLHVTYDQVSGQRENENERDEERKVYDNIHGFIYFEKLIWDFIDTPHFQRLRKIKQLGCLEFVFPGATNTRFEHSIGTAHLAKRFIELLIKNNPKSYPEEQIKSAVLTITIAGLLHDLGHGPYSHTFDSYIVTQIAKVGQEKPIPWKHEIASVELFEHLIKTEELKGKLTPTQVKRVRALIEGEVDGIREWQFQIISNKKNGIDVDKFDYFRRDSFYMGAKNIYVDHQLLMNEARIIGKQICYPQKYAETVYNIFHCRYKLYKNYYNNIINKGIQLMICDILKLTREKFEFKKACEDIYSKPQRYLKLTDSILQKIEDIYQRICNNTSPADQKYRDEFKMAVDILNRIKTRKIYKFVKQFHYYIREDENKAILTQFQKWFDKNSIIEYICKDAGILENQICISISDIGFGLKQENPLKKVTFFKKEQGLIKMKPEEAGGNLSMLFTSAFTERSIKLFIKKNGSALFNKVDKSFTKYCKLFNTQCQELLKKHGVKVVFEGRGGRTPYNEVPQNEIVHNQPNANTNPLLGLSPESLIDP